MLPAGCAPVPCAGGLAALTMGHAYRRSPAEETVSDREPRGKHPRSRLEVPGEGNPHVCCSACTHARCNPGDHGSPPSASSCARGFQ